MANTVNNLDKLGHFRSLWIWPGIFLKFVLKIAICCHLWFWNLGNN